MNVLQDSKNDELPENIYVGIDVHKKVGVCQL